MRKRRNPTSNLYIAISALLLIGVCAGMMLFVLEEMAAPTEVPAPIATSVPEDYTGRLRISELMARNRATLADENGEFHDYVELENCSGETVDLTGWYMTDRENKIKWIFPHLSMEPGEFLTVFCGGTSAMSAGFSLSQGETVYLFAPSGQMVDSLLCTSDAAGVALALAEDGEFHETYWATPGYPNTRQGYADFCAALEARGPVVINEVMTANSLYAIQPGMEAADWVELKNISDTAVDLSGWRLSDDHDNYARWSLPELILAPGETRLIYCSGSEERIVAGEIHASFSLNAAAEELYLTDSRGELVDYVYLHHVPANGSMGRMDGEGGFFYFSVPSPGADNTGGVRFVSDVPAALTPDGSYNDTDGLFVELSSPGTVYYTTDGSLPTPGSAVYEAPIFIDQTTVIRAAALEDGGLMSPVATYSYFVNENHTLPVLSLVVDDEIGFNTIYNKGWKNTDIPANAALYDGDSSFNHRCSVSMKGWTSLLMPKKSLGIDFGSIYGGDLYCDVFGNGITQYGSLSVRAGQDYGRSVFRNELLEDLALEMGGRVYTQYSKFCILYINGRYCGIYCLKEDISRQYFASRNGVSKDSVTMYRPPVAQDTEFYREVIQYSNNNSLSNEENYQYMCSMIDIDSLIDWFIIEGYSANTDISANARVFRSTENGGKWVFAAYDFDWAFYYDSMGFSNILQRLGRSGNQIPPLISNLLTNPDFRQRFLTRFAELNRTVLSNEHVLEKIDQYAALLAPEIPRERERWGSDVSGWEKNVQKLRSFILDNDWEQHNIQTLRTLLHLTEDELAEYFG